MVIRIDNYPSYSVHQAFRVKWLPHYCYKCGTPLSVKKSERIVRRDSEDAKYFKFSGSGFAPGDYMFVHEVFFCPKCNKEIEIPTLLSIENMILSMEKAERHFRKQGFNLSLDGSFETKEGKTVKTISDISEIKNVFFEVFVDETLIGTYKSPILREDINERPYYFSVKKKDLINFIQSLL